MYMMRNGRGSLKSVSEDVRRRYALEVPPFLDAVEESMRKLVTKFDLDD